MRSNYIHYVYWMQLKRFLEFYLGSFLYSKTNNNHYTIKAKKWLISSSNYLFKSAENVKKCIKQMLENSFKNILFIELY